MKHMKIIKLTCLLAIIGQMTSCSDAIEVPTDQLPDFVDKIVINAALDNINPIEIEVSNSAWAYNTDLPEVAGTADLILTGPGGEIPLTYNSGTKTYRALSPAVVGATYVLVGSRKNYQTIRASCVVPPKVSNKAVGWVENGGRDIDGNLSDRVYIRFNDPSGKNYYLVHFYYYSESADLFIPFDFPLNDPSLKAASTVQTTDGGFLFTDDLFSGQNKELAVVPSMGLVAANIDIKYLIELRSISEDYYKYQTSLQRYRDQQDGNSNGPFSSAVIVHSNINNGLGAFLSSTLESDTLR